MKSRLEEKFKEQNIYIKTTFSFIEGVLDNECEQQFKDVDLILVCLNFEQLCSKCYDLSLLKSDEVDELVNELSIECQNIYYLLKQKTKTKIIWLGFEDYDYKFANVIGNNYIKNNIVDFLNNQLNDVISEEDVFIDLKKIVAKNGAYNAYNDKGKYRWNAPYSDSLISDICDEIFKQYKIYQGITPKCIVLDCDNVLWGGILSECGLGKIDLGGSRGRLFRDFQKFILSLYYHGVILAICSKNDEEDVLEVFRSHSAMILKEEHIACFKINWNKKYENIKDIAKALNISLDSIVFVDDSKFEINSVKTILPEVHTILFNVKSIYDELSIFNLNFNSNIDVVKQRNYTFKTDIKRQELKRKSISYDEYLRLLDTKVKIKIAESSDLTRISELTQRTNKYTNGRRYTVNELVQKVNCEEYTLYSVSVSDKFSDLGLVGAIGIFNNTLDLFSLSCRALGRKVEIEMFKIIKNHTVVNFEVIKTNKNSTLVKELENFFLCNI